MTIPTYTLNDGSTLPAIGFGTAGLRGNDAIEATARRPISGSMKRIHLS